MGRGASQVKSSSKDELFDHMRQTKMPQEMKDALWQQISTELDHEPASPLGGATRTKRMAAAREWAVGAAGVAVVLIGGFAVWQHERGPNGQIPAAKGVSNLAGNTASNATAPDNSTANAASPTNTPNQTKLPVLHSFDATQDWRQPNTSPYSSGLSTVATPGVPSAFEQSLRPQQGTAEVLVSPIQGGITANQVTNPNAFGPRWAQTIRFTSGSLRINGHTYTVPSTYSKQKLLVLPVDHGIVWSPVTAEPNSLRNVPKALPGSTPLFYTPYLPHGGSLATGAKRIAAVPHSWMAPDGPVIASAWTGWLPPSQVAMPTVQSDTVRHLTFKQTGQTEQLTSASPVQGAVPGWPTVQMRDLTKSAYYKKPHDAAFVQSLTRTNGGVVMTLNFMDATMSGRNAGVTGANYYWSEQTGKWTPIDQNYTVQTLPGWTDVGSNGVYSVQPLPVGNGSGNELDVAEMHFDPATLTTSSVWMGDWLYGPSFVDGNSWVTVLSRDMPNSATAAPKKWTVYTPIRKQS